MQHYVAWITEAQILDDNNKFNHIEAVSPIRAYRQIIDTQLNHYNHY